MKFITLEEASKMLNLHPEVVRKKARQGVIPAVKLGTGLRAPWRFSHEEIEKYIAGETAPVKEAELHDNYLIKLINQMKTMKDEEKIVSAIHEIGLLGSEDAVPELTRNILDDETNDTIKYYSIRALMKILGVDSKRYVYKFMDYPNPWISIEVALFFAKKEMDDKAIEFLKSSYADRKDQNTLIALAQIDYEYVKDDFLALFEHKAIAYRYKALTILDNVKGADYEAILKPLLTDREHKIKRKAIQLVGELKLKNLLQDLTNLLSTRLTDDLKKCIGDAISGMHTR